MNGVNDMSFIHVYMDEWREWHVIHPCIHGWMAWMTCHSSMYTWMNGVNDMSFIHVKPHVYMSFIHIRHSSMSWMNGGYAWMTCIHGAWHVHSSMTFIHVMDEWRRYHAYRSKNTDKHVCSLYMSKYTDEHDSCTLYTCPSHAISKTQISTSPMHTWRLNTYGVPTISRLLKIIGLFCRL